MKKKIRNGEYPTWYVLKRLSADDDLYAKAPDTDQLCPCDASTDGMHVKFVTHFSEGGSGDLVGEAPIRSDWTIYRRKSNPFEIGFATREKIGFRWPILSDDLLNELKLGSYKVTIAFMGTK
jgi:hypothetical protein